MLGLVFGHVGGGDFVEVIDGVLAAALAGVEFGQVLVGGIFVFV